MATKMKIKSKIKKGPMKTKESYEYLRKVFNKLPQYTNDLFWEIMGDGGEYANILVINQFHHEPDVDYFPVVSFWFEYNVRHLTELHMSAGYTIDPTGKENFKSVIVLPETKQPVITLNSNDVGTDFTRLNRHINESGKKIYSFMKQRVKAKYKLNI